MTPWARLDILIFHKSIQADLWFFAGNVLWSFSAGNNHSAAF